jgi:hypothetical protein
MLEIRVTAHAVARYVERIGAASAEEARAILSGPVVATAARFGARVVRLPKGRIIIDLGEHAATVITVVPLDHLPFHLIPAFWGGPPPVAHCRSLPPMEKTDG